MKNQQGAPEALRRAQYLTVVYRGIKPGDEARELIMHPKMTASSWSHVMNERDHLAALVEAQQPAAHVQNPAEIEHVACDVSKNKTKSNMSTQPAPATQQEPQEPWAWCVTGCAQLLDEDDAKAEARHIGGTARAMPLYTAPQPSPTAQAAESVPAGEYPAMPEPFIGVQDRPWGGHAEVIRSAIGEDGVVSCYTANQMRAYVDADRAARAPADSVLEDAARLDFLIKQRAYVVSDPDACPGYWLHFVHKETGKCWAQADEHPTPRAAIDAAMKAGDAT